MEPTHLPLFFSFAHPTRFAEPVAKKYKTEICRNWAQGHCKYWGNCIFAHGVTELRDKIIPVNYKTKHCVNLLRCGFCMYGERCQFRHQDDSFDTAPEDEWIVNSREDSLERKLPVFIEMERRCI